MSDETSDEVTVTACGPGSPSCECACPGPCGHVWDGPEVTSDDGLSGSVTCSRCGAPAMEHDLWTLL